MRLKVKARSTLVLQHMHANHTFPNPAAGEGCSMHRSMLNARSTLVLQHMHANHTFPNPAAGEGCSMHCSMLNARSTLVLQHMHANHTFPNPAAGEGCSMRCSMLNAHHPNGSIFYGQDTIVAQTWHLVGLVQHPVVLIQHHCIQ